MTLLANALSAWLKDGAIIATLIRTEGSTPRETGAAMIISQSGISGSIGGGQLEFHVTDVALALLDSGELSRELDLPLGPQMGQCCGGRVLVRLERATAAHVDMLTAQERIKDNEKPAILVFGAGHTGRALVKALCLLPFAVTLIDDRDGVFNDLPHHVACRHLVDPVDVLANLPANTACVIMTHSHALDYRLAEAALGRGDMAYVGLIGSATKRAGFASGFRYSGGTAEELERLTCPIGGGLVRDKRPEIIAALVVAELITRLLPARHHP
jgi:xanthine dehydrogenase accessory factor